MGKGLVRIRKALLTSTATSINSQFLLAALSEMEPLIFADENTALTITVLHRIITVPGSNELNISVIKGEKYLQSAE